MKIWKQNTFTIMEVPRHTYTPQVKHVWASHITSCEYTQFLLNYGKGFYPIRDLSHNGGGKFRTFISYTIY